MRKSASEILRNLEQRIARLEKQSSTNRTALNIPVDIKSVQAAFRDLDDLAYRDEDNRTTYLNPRNIKSLQEEILEAANKNLQDPDGFMDEIYEIADNWFNTRSYGPDHNAQEEFFDMAEEFVDDYLAD